MIFYNTFTCIQFYFSDLFISRYAANLKVHSYSRKTIFQKSNKDNSFEMYIIVYFQTSHLPRCQQQVSHSTKTFFMSKLFNLNTNENAND